MVAGSGFGKCGGQQQVTAVMALPPSQLGLPNVTCRSYILLHTLRMDDDGLQQAMRRRLAAVGWPCHFLIAERKLIQKRPDG